MNEVRSNARKLALERSNQDAQSSNEHARTAAQSAILINGGAATAILAYFSKDGVSSMISSAVSLALALYAFGVVAGALMMFTRMYAAGQWAESWRSVSVGHFGDKFESQAGRWVKASYVFFGCSILCFAVASSAMATAFFERSRIQTEAVSHSPVFPSLEKAGRSNRAPPPSSR
jgi:cyanophycinase-like exopeptidase